MGPLYKFELFFFEVSFHREKKGDTFPTADLEMTVLAVLAARLYGYIGNNYAFMW